MTRRAWSMEPCSRFSTSIEEAICSALAAPARASRAVAGSSARGGGCGAGAGGCQGEDGGLQHLTYSQERPQLLERDVIVEPRGGQHVVLDDGTIQHLRRTAVGRRWTNDQLVRGTGCTARPGSAGRAARRNRE